MIFQRDFCDERLNKVTAKASLRLYGTSKLDAMPKIRPFRPTLGEKFTTTNKWAVVTFKFSFEKELVNISIKICSVLMHSLTFKLICFETRPFRAMPL